MHNRLTTKTLAAFGAIVLALAACGDSDDGSSAEATATAATDAPTETAVTNPPATDPPATDPPATDPPATDPPVTDPPATDPPATDPPAAEPASWRSVDHGEGCSCADGSEYRLWERPADPTRVVLYFEGGGACFTAETCSFDDGTYTSSLDLEEPPRDSGLFDASNAENPLAGHSIVYVPYCTGDVFLGAATTNYADGLDVEHNGFANASAGLDLVLENYPDAEQLVVTGASAGSVPTPLFAGLAADRFPDTTDIVTFGDSSGAYPDVPAINETIGVLWGSTSVIPDWPENEGLTAVEYSIPGLYVQTGLHAPNVRLARFDYAFDATQAFFGSLAGVAADELVTLIDETEALAETSGSELATFVAPGDDHTIMRSPEVYELEVEGVRLIDWLTELVGGTTPADVHCVDCTL